MSDTSHSGDGLNSAAVQHLLGRSAFYEVLSLALAYPEDETLMRLADLTSDLKGHAVLDALNLSGPFSDMRAASAGVDAERLAPVHFALFEGSVLCSPHETEYIRDGLAKSAQLADIAGFYRAFGLRTSSEHQTVPDNIGAELEFMAQLTRKEAYAEVEGWSEHAEVCRDAGRDFLHDHLGRWSAAFARDLHTQSAVAAASRGDAAAATWYRAVAGLLVVFLGADMRSLGIRPSLLYTRVIGAATEGPPDCPMAALQAGAQPVD